MHSKELLCIHRKTKYYLFAVSLASVGSYVTATAPVSEISHVAATYGAELVVSLCHDLDFNLVLLHSVDAYSVNAL